MINIVGQLIYLSKHGRGKRENIDSCQCYSEYSLVIFPILVWSFLGYTVFAQYVNFLIFY